MNTCKCLVAINTHYDTCSIVVIYESSYVSVLSIKFSGYCTYLSNFMEGMVYHKS